MRKILILLLVMWVSAMGAASLAIAEPSHSTHRAVSKTAKAQKKAHAKSKAKHSSSSKPSTGVIPYEKLRAMDDPLAQALAKWWRLRDGDKNATFQEVTDFIRAHPTWPDQRTLQRRAEESISAVTPHSSILSFFKTNPPLTAKGKWAFAKARFAAGDSSEETISILRDAWITGNWGGDDSREFLSSFGKFLRQEDHHERINELLWDEKITEARAMLPYADSAHQKLYNIRLMLMRENGNSGNPDSLLSELSPELRDDEGLLFERLRFRERRGRYVEMASLMPGNDRGAMSHYDKWWDMKQPLIRKLIEGEHYHEAYSVASAHGAEDGTEDFSEGEWLAGWIALRFLKDSDTAYSHFYQMYHHVKYPVSLSRGAYWAGRAAEDNKNKDIARGWYQVAANYPSTFYGQLALAKLKRSVKSALPSEATFEDGGVDSSRNNELLQAVRLLVRFEQLSYAKRFILAAIQNAKSPAEMERIAQFGKKLNRPLLAVEAAKEALRQGTLLVPTGYPKTSVPRQPLEPELALAIIRQESMFDTNAQSPAGARGLMQLMPATASEVARKNGIKAPLKRLQADPNVNVQVGTAYLHSLVSKYDGSYVLAIAAYNGGPGNVAKWRNAFGDINGKSLDDTIDWIERIPFKETRTYVHRVLENLQIYRAMADSDDRTLVKDLGGK